VIRYLEQKEINKSAWDHCVRSSTNSQPYALSWYLDLVAANWAALIEENDAGYSAVFPLPWTRKLGIRHIYTPFFCQQLGLFGSSSYALEDFIKAIPRKYLRVNLQIQANNEPVLTGIQVEKKPNYKVNLDQEYAAIRSSFSENTRRNIKKAAKNELKLETGWDPAAFMQCLKTNQGPGIPELKEAEYNRIQSIIETALEREEGDTVQVLDKEGFICGIFTLRGTNGPVYLFGTSNQRARTSGAMAFAFNHLLSLYAKDGERANTGMFDFEGSSIPGLSRFYRGFGALDIPYFMIRRGI
jgi:hypothetical protein